MKEKIKKLIIKWLGLDIMRTQINILDKRFSDLSQIGIDVHFKEPHMIIIFSKLNGGQIRHIEANFENLSDLNDFVKELKNRFKPKDVIWDIPQYNSSLIKSIIDGIE